MKKLNQKGFTLVEGLLIVIALAAITGVGFYIYNSNKDKPEANTTPVSTNQKPKSDTPQKKYLKIPELGIKLELNDTINDAYYHTKDTSFAYVSVRYFDSLKGFESCGVSAGDQGGRGIGTITKAKVGEDDGFGSPLTEEQLEQKKDLAGAKIDDTYYLFTPQSQVPCYDQNTISQDNPDVQKLGEYKNAFAEQIKTATKL